MGFHDIRNQAIRRTPDETLKHLQSFNLDLKFSAGIWFFSPPNSRFHDVYSDSLDIEQRLDIAAGLIEYGLLGLEAHYPNEINEDNLDFWKEFIKSTGMKMVTIVPLLFWDKGFEFGALSSTNEKSRRVAIDRTIKTLEINKELDTEFAVVWPGIDGYENPFGIDFIAMRDRFIDGLCEAMDAVPGVRIAFEPKPYEPRGHIIFPTTAEGVMLCNSIESRLKNPENLKIISDEHALACMNPEIGHALMAYEDLPYSYSIPLGEGRLAHMHLNSQPLGNYDQDLNVGVIAPEQFEALMYVLKMHAYSGWFGIDINPERMPVATALKISMDAIRAANDRINEMDHESIVYAVNNPEKCRGWLEAYLIRARASHPERLSKLAPPEREN